MATSDATTTQADSGTGTTQADAAASDRVAEAIAVEDIGQAEAYILNLKRLVADELDHDQFMRASRERLIRNGEDGDQTHRSQGDRAIEQSLQLQAKLNDQYLGLVAQLNAASISERERTVRVGDIASDNMWTSDVAYDTIAQSVAAKVLSALGKPSA